jgi:hypothetical protein
MEKMAIVNDEKYKPPQEYQNKYQGNEFFNDQYQRYIANLQKDLTTSDAGS